MSEVTFDDLREQLLQSVKDIREELDPDEDWLPVMLFVSKDGKRGVIPIPEYVGQPGIPFIKEIIERLEIVHFGMVQMGWGLELDKAEVDYVLDGRDVAEVDKSELLGDRLPPSVNENRIEMLMLMFGMIEDGKVRYELETAYVTRNEDGPPDLQWQKTVKEPQGALAEAYTEALEANID